MRKTICMLAFMCETLFGTLKEIKTESKRVFYGINFYILYNTWIMVLICISVLGILSTLLVHIFSTHPYKCLRNKLFIYTYLRNQNFQKV